jgi:hypothetical protein
VTDCLSPNRAIHDPSIDSEPSTGALCRGQHRVQVVSYEMTNMNPPEVNPSTVIALDALCLGLRREGKGRDAAEAEAEGLTVAQETLDECAGISCLPLLPAAPAAPVAGIDSHSQSNLSLLSLRGAVGDRGRS